MLTIISLTRVSLLKCKHLKVYLQNNYNLGHNQHPTDLNKLMKILQNYVVTKGAQNPTKVSVTGLSFLQPEAKLVKGAKGRLNPRVDCRKC